MTHTIATPPQPVNPPSDAEAFSRFVGRLAAEGDADARAMVRRWHEHQRESGE